MAAINFLETREDRIKSTKYLLAVLLLSLVFFYIFAPSVAFTIVLVAMILFFALNLEYGFYFALLFVFMHGLEVQAGRYDFLSGLNFLAGVNAPLIDFIVLLLSVSMIVATVFGLYEITLLKIKRLLPGALLYALFLGTAWLSAKGAYGQQVGESGYYVLYPMLFVYVAFVMLPLAVILTKEIMQKVFKILFWVGVFTAVFGLLGVVVSVLGHGWVRAVPYAVFGIAPFGYNHNMLGEVLTAIIPLGVYLVYIHQKHKDRERYFYGTLLMVAVAMLTLSRTAWLVLLLDGLLVAWLFWAEVWPAVKKQAKRASLSVWLVLVAILIYMAGFLGSSLVKSSNEARWLMTEIPIFYLEQNPLLGVGPNMFIPVLSDTLMFTQNFGEPLDAHGWIQKVFMETGLLGGIFFSGFLAYVLWRVFSQAKKEQDLMLLTLFFVGLSAVVFQLFSTSYFNANMWFPLGLALSGLQLSRYQDKSDAV